MASNAFREELCRWRHLICEVKLSVFNLGMRWFRKRGFNFKNKHLLRSTQPFSTLKISFFVFFFGFKSGGKNKYMPQCVFSTLESACTEPGGTRSRSVRQSGQLGLLWLLVQLHVGNQDVLLSLFRVWGVGAAVTGPLVRPPRSNGSPAVEIDHTDYEHHQQQACHHNNN